MHSHFPLFRSHLDLAHQYWEKLLQAGDWAIDATCGNGHDTLKLAEILENKKGGVIGIDIQPEAIAKTEQLLGEYDVALYCQSHADFPLLAKEKPIRLIIYNLGYLPGGNKAFTTMTENTLTSVRKASTLIVPGGAFIDHLLSWPRGRRKRAASSFTRAGPVAVRCLEYLSSHLSPAPSCAVVIFNSEVNSNYLAFSFNHRANTMAWKKF